MVAGCFRDAGSSSGPGLRPQSVAISCRKTASAIKATRHPPTQPNILPMVAKHPLRNARIPVARFEGPNGALEARRIPRSFRRLSEVVGNPETTLAL